MADQIAKGEVELGGSFAEHRITGYVTHALNKGIDPKLNVPLVSHVEGGLYQGGCRNGVLLPAGFDFVLSLYPWEKYRLPEGTERLEVVMYDGLDQATDEVDDLANEIVERLSEGQKVLVHCQAGCNRSALIAARVLMKRGHTADSAIALLRKQRTHLVLCNDTFENWLRSLED